MNIYAVRMIVIYNQSKTLSFSKETGMKTPFNING